MTKKSLPPVSVLMTAYNAERFIGLALESLSRQTYKNLQIVVVDDGSTDRTAEIVAALAKNDARLEFFQLKNNLGPSLASNFGLEKVRGELIARMDADDIAFEDRIEKQVRFLEHHPEVVLVGGQCLLINEESEIIGEKRFPLTHEEIYQSLFLFTPIQHPSCLINAQLFPKKKLNYHNHSFLAHDLELIFELAQYGKLANLPETVLYYRQSRDSLSLKSPKETFRATFAIRHKALRRYHYRPNLRGWLAHLAQSLTIALLPESLIYPLFKKLRLKKVNGKEKRRGAAWGWQNSFTGALLREKLDG